MKVTLKQLVKSRPHMADALNLKGIASDLKIRLAHVGKAADLVFEKLEERNRELIAQFSNEPNKDQIKPEDKEAMTAYQKAWEKELEAIVKLPGKPIPYEMISGTALTAGDLAYLDWLIALPALKAEDRDDDEDAPLAAAAASGD